MPGREAWSDLVTLDINASHAPDIVHDIADLPLPFDDDSFDEVHAYEVMEHMGQQGDWRFFFAQWADLWRILKPGGCFFGTSPDYRSVWAWGDPGHTRLITQGCLAFLHQPSYTHQVGRTPMTDYRFCYKADFDMFHSQVSGETYQYGLQAVKPSRITT